MLNSGLDTNSTPKFFYNCITDISPEDIIGMGAKAVGIDLDNTSFYDNTTIPFPGVLEWLKKIKEAGIPVIIITNTYNLRAKLISKKTGGLPYVGNAKKPDTACFFKAAEFLGISVTELAMIGDQLFADIQGANNAGAISIRVRYRHPEIFFPIRYRIVRYKEKLYLKNKGLGDKV